MSDQLAKTGMVNAFLHLNERQRQKLPGNRLSAGHEEMIELADSSGYDEQ